MVHNGQFFRFPVCVALVQGLAGCDVPPADGLPEQAASEELLRAPCAGSPYASLQAAINATAAGGVVAVCSGTFNERLTITRSITLRANSGAAVTILDAQRLGTGIRITGGGTVTIDGFTIRNGGTAGNGGNVSCSNTGLTLKNSVLTNGSAAIGGGIASVGCWGTILDNTISTNSGGTGGGAYVSGNSMVVSGNDLVDNHANMDGAGIYVNGSSPLRLNLIDGNDADRYGGGAFVHNSLGEIADNVISNNDSVDDGGGLYMYLGAGSVARNQIVDNYSDDDGGGLRLKLSRATITDNTVSRNLATNTGGGVKISHEATTISGNTFADNEAYYYAGGVLLEESASDFFDNTITGNHAPNGGGLYIERGWDDVLVEDCTITGNTADGNGGNVFLNVVGQTITMRRVDVASGVASVGGGLYALDTDIVVSNSTFWRNNGRTSGGGLYVKNTTGSLINNVAAANTSPGGAGLRISTGVALTVENFVLSSNTGSAGVHLSSGAAPTWKFNDVHGNTSAYYGMPAQTGLNGNLAVTPAFVNATTGDFRLAATSTLINAGDSTLFDVNGTRSDMGFYGGVEGW